MPNRKRSYLGGIRLKKLLTHKNMLRTKRSKSISKKKKNHLIFKLIAGEEVFWGLISSSIIRISFKLFHLFNAFGLFRSFLFNFFIFQILLNHSSAKLVKSLFDKSYLHKSTANIVFIRIDKIFVTIFYLSQ